MIRYFWAIIVILYIVNTNIGFGQSNIDDGGYSAIVEADGYAYLAENKTIQQIREEAKAIAKREALEKAQTYIKSMTRVENYKLTYDLIESGSEGTVKILESKDYGITADNRYHYWVKAEIKYMLKISAKEKSIGIMSDDSAPLTVTLRTEKGEYALGDEIRIFIQGNKNFYANIVYEDATGNLIQILPNQYRKDNLFKGNREYMIPDKNDNFSLRIQPPFGTEKIRLYASINVLGKADITPFGKSFYNIRDNLDEYSEKTRGIDVVGKENAGAEFFETSCPILTKDKAIDRSLIDSLPIFPWPPPQASSWMVIPYNMIRTSSNELLTFKDVNQKFERALSSCGYSDKSYYAILDGFAIVTRLEQINQDGTPKEPPERWLLDVQPLRIFSLKEYLKALFTAKVGYYRIIVFIFSPHSFSHTAAKVSSQEAQEWFSPGGNTLPSSIEQKVYSKKYKCTALIYEFEQYGSDERPEVKSPGRLTAKTHLEQANLWQMLEK
ncbi:MAG: DUF4384 domain-containing protein [Candidatus Hodarchaeota archaeon]